MAKRKILIIAAVAVCAVLGACLAAGAFSGKQNNSAQDKVDPKVLESLKSRYPEYFGLDTFKGLEVYVWQMAAGDYSWGVLPGTNRSKEATELAALKGVSAADMRAILSTYDIPEENIEVIPIRQVYSSYFGPDISTPGYKAMVREMLFKGDPSDMVSTHELFSTIMSSPATSSASSDYLAAHEAEHRKLLEDKEITLRYIFKVFLDAEKHGTPENGLHGVLMRTVLDELSPELMLDLVATPQEYFDAWKDMALKQHGDHSDDWLKQNYPAAYILKQVLAE